MERARTRLLLLAAFCGVVIVLLSFGSWVHFSTITFSEAGGEPIDPVSIELKGYETSRSRDREELNRGDVPEADGWCSCRVGVGDGYVTAALGAFVIMASAATLATRRDRVFAIGIVVASVGTLLLGGYNALGQWQAVVWTQAAQTEFVKGSTDPALWALVVVATIGAVLGAGLWALARAEARLDEEYDDEDFEEDDDLAPERMNAWA